jgi:hypothetical protein
MSGYDIFAWIVLLILVASAIGVFWIAGWLPGHIAKSRGHPWAQAVGKTGRPAAWLQDLHHPSLGSPHNFRFQA